MKTKKIFIIIGVVVAILICAILIFNSKIEVEYIPETEISDNDLRKTIVTLYFKKNGSDEIEKESRLIDSKDLLLDPYTELVKMLITGPNNGELEHTVPLETNINKVEMHGNTLCIDFSEEFISNQDNLKYNIEIIQKTLTELNEVNEVNISICGNFLEIENA